MKNKMLLLAAALTVAYYPQLLAEDDDDEEIVIEEEVCDYDIADEGAEYNPMRRYYPYCSIYHDSCVRDDYPEDPPPTWAGKREDFSDELSR